MKNALTVDQDTKKSAAPKPGKKPVPEPPETINLHQEGTGYFRDLCENSLAGEYVLQDGHMIYVNPAFARVFAEMGATTRTSARRMPASAGNTSRIQMK